MQPLNLLWKLLREAQPSTNAHVRSAEAELRDAGYHGQLVDVLSCWAGVRETTRPR
jgi:hypothetical protein